MTLATETSASDEAPLLPLHRQSGFLSFLLSRLAAVFAMQIQAIVVAWQVYDITRDPMALAYVGLAQFLPMVLLLLPAGDFVDRFSRKRILQLSWMVQGLCSVLLLTLSLNESHIMWAAITMFWRCLVPHAPLPAPPYKACCPILCPGRNLLLR